MSEAFQLDVWLAQEREVLERMEQGTRVQADSPSPSVGMSGLSVLEAMLRGELPYPALAGASKFRLLEVADGRVVLQGRPGPLHLTPIGAIQGGWWATVLQSAMGCAIHTKMPPGRRYTTAQIGVKRVQDLHPELLRVRAEGKVTYLGHRLVTAEAHLHGPDGALYAHATTTCFISEPVEARS